ncbi:MAG TPA: type 1 glutamine amidotransferase [Puia sp.]|jgi:GMP synthase-like glutamine amidotransferase|nr:type 1 glutamine amidotransferase [Puia sp.]
MRYHCLQHVSFETPGLLIGLIREKGHSLRTTALYREEPLPATADFDGLIIMGGPMSIHDEDVHSWLRAEKELIAAAIREGKKVLGICLGAQLIAAALGARVYPNLQKEIGFWPVQWTEAGVSPGLGPRAAVGGPGGARAGEALFFHWHGETFDLPAGAVLLASTPACVNQAFRFGDKVLGIQFHPEVTPEIIREMVEQEGWELVEGPYIQSAEKILEAGQAEAGQAPRSEGRQRSGGEGRQRSGGFAGLDLPFLTDWL